jgi:drug/metabolite transporter (DMT)-like permease
MAVTLGGITWVVSERSKGAPLEAFRAHHAPPRAIVLAVVAALAQSAGLAFAKRGMANYDDPFAATQIRVIAGIIGFIVLMTLIGHLGRTWRATRDTSSMGQLFIGSITGPLLGVSLLMLSLNRGVSVGVAQTLTSLVPVLILPVAIFQKRERVTWRAAMGAVIAVAGVAILMLGDRWWNSL